MSKIAQQIAATQRYQANQAKKEPASKPVPIPKPTYTSRIQGVHQDVNQVKAQNQAAEASMLAPRQNPILGQPKQLFTQPTQQQVQNETQPTPQPSLGDKIKQSVAKVGSFLNAIPADVKGLLTSDYGQDPNAIKKAQPSLGEKVSAITKYPFEVTKNLASGAINASMAINLEVAKRNGDPQRIKEAQEEIQNFNQKVGTALNTTFDPQTPGEAKVTQIADYATAVPAGIVGGLKDVGEEGAKILANMAEKEVSKSIKDKVVKYGEDYAKHLSEKEVAELSAKKVAGTIADVKSAAVKGADGTIYEGASHNEAIAKAPKAEQADLLKNKGENGLFKTTDGKLITRDQALKKYGVSSSEDFPHLAAKQVGDKNPELIAKDIKDLSKIKPNQAPAALNEAERDAIINKTKQFLESGKLPVKDAEYVQDFLDRSEKGKVTKDEISEMDKYLKENKIDALAPKVKESPIIEGKPKVSPVKTFDAEKVNRQISYVKQGQAISASKNKGILQLAKEEAERKKLFSGDVQKTFENATVAKGNGKQSIWSAVKDLFDPIHGVKEGIQIKNAFREHAAQFRYNTSQTIKNSAERQKFWDKMKPSDQLTFIHSIETDTPLKGDNGMFSEYKKAFQKDYETMSAIDPKAPYRKNYFTHNGLWSDPQKAEEFYNKWSTEQFGGGKKFFKARSFPTVYDGLKNGLELKEANPEKLFLNNHINVQKAKMADDFTKEMAVKGMPKGAVQAVVDRYMDRGIKGNPIISSIQGVNNALNTFQLGLSAFHFTTTSVNSITSKAALGIKELTQGRILSGSKHLLETPISVFTDIARGSKAFKDNPELEKNIATIIRGGGTVEKVGGYDTKQWGKMMSNFGEGKYVQGALRSPGAVMNKISAPLMDYFVPRVKVGSFLSGATSELERIGANATVDEQRASLSKVWDSADNRFGQLVQDNLLWNQTFKDVMNLDTRSLGWNLGTIRELGGGVKDVVSAKEGSKIPFSKLLDDLKTGKGISDRTAYTVALPIVTGVIATAIMKTQGQTPQSALDYFYPRTGDKTKQGYDERLSIPGYMKDVFSYKNNPLQTILNKQSPVATLGAGLFELAHTGGIKDFYGNWAVDPYASFEDKSKQFMSYAVGQFTPFSVSSSNQRVDQSLGAKIESGLGFQPASSTITKGDQATQLSTMWRDMLPTPPKTPVEAKAFTDKLNAAPGKQGMTPEQAQKEIDFLTELRKTGDGTPERAKVLNDYYSTLSEDQRKSINYKLMLAGISTKGVSTSDTAIKGKQLYSDIQGLMDAGKTNEAYDKIDSLSPEDKKLYDVAKASAEKQQPGYTPKTTPANPEQDTFDQIQSQIKSGDTASAQKTIDSMSDADYANYIKLRTSYRAKNTSTVKERLNSDTPEQAVRYVRSLPTDEGQRIIDNMTDAEYSQYQAAKTKLDNQQ